MPVNPPPELLGLLRACKEEPDDDVPRLILADWLEERNGPTDAERAELIRIHCAIDRTPTDLERRGELCARATLLLAMHKAAWLGPLAVHGTLWRGLLHLMIQPSARSSPILLDPLIEAANDEPGVWLTSLVV